VVYPRGRDPGLRQGYGGGELECRFLGGGKSDANVEQVEPLDSIQGRFR